MMGAIVLSMLVSWLGAVMALMIWSRGGDETLTEATVDERARITGAPRLAPDDGRVNIDA